MTMRTVDERGRGLNKVLDCRRTWKVCVRFLSATSLRPWTDRGQGLFKDYGRFLRGLFRRRRTAVARMPYRKFR